MKRVPWITAAVLIVIIFGSIYGVVQQSQRNDADWPQVQLAEDAALLVKGGALPQSVTGTPINMTQSLGTFVNVYNGSGKVLAASGSLGNGKKIPAPPPGMLTSANGTTYKRVTWAPAKGVRIAAVIVPAGKDYVLSGRSLKVVEQNENHTLWLSLGGGIVALVVLYLGYRLAESEEELLAQETKKSRKR